MYFILLTILEQLSGAIAVGISVLSYIFPALLERSGFIGYAPNFILCFLFPNWALKNFIRLLIEFECNGKINKPKSCHYTQVESNSVLSDWITPAIFSCRRRTQLE